MISKLKIDKAATFVEPVEIIPTEINYLYGSNGSGKTTLSKVIADSIPFTSCELSWKTSPIQTLVYNRDFVKANFGQSSAIKGIFTLGSGTKDAREFIDETNLKIEGLKTNIEGLKNSWKAKNEDEEGFVNTAVDKCWSIKTKFESTFRPAYTGFIGSAKSFFEKCVAEQTNTSTLLTWDAIKEKCDRVYSSSLQTHTMISVFDFSELPTIEASEILGTKIIGKEDVAIGELIKKLNNSDWVKEGVDYLKITDTTCPFCQQDVTSELKFEIENFFDETYANKCKELSDFKIAYASYVATKIAELEAISASQIDILNFEELITQIQLLKELYKNNLTKLEGKIKSPSIPIELETLDTIFSIIKTIVEAYRTIITKNNDTFSNIGAEKTQLKGEIWKFIVNELDVELKAYTKAVDGTGKAKKSISDSIKLKEVEKKAFEKQIKEKETEITGITHTVTEINKILSLFGFTNFSLSEASEKGFYKIVREDLSEVKETLSEGEYTFITFLYFFQLLKGSTEDSGISKDKVVVFDDPISSLDSNVLFVVSNLIKEVIQDCRQGKNGIKQVFVLTHNIYFHKEVTFRGGRDKGKWREETFWIVRKLGNKSNIIKHEDNPIQTTYELLWRELDILEDINKATIFNTLRRILEYYFNIIGGLDYEKCINEFDGEEKIICKSLVSWTNDGSHFINDDLVVYVEPESIERYMTVFKSIFEKMDHLSHYNMMMRFNKETA
jgi:wobble nucleotide-excising tRNase